MHSQSLIDMPTIQPITSTTYGLKSGTQPQRLVFSTFTDQSAFLGGSNFPVGVDVFTSPLIVPGGVYATETTSVGAGTFDVTTYVTSGSVQGA